MRWLSRSASAASPLPGHGDLAAEANLGRRLSDGLGVRLPGVPLVAGFATTLFVSALLLFLIQPMVGKMILPLLGGTPAVWNTCMVFFQAALLAGYAYAHTTVAWLGVRRQATLHLIVLLIPLFVLPIAMAGGSAPPTDANPVLWLLWRLLVAVGLPFFAVSASAPLLQKWFAYTGHRDAKDPYFLYAASNTGSLLALLGYPLLLEPSLVLVDQSRIWAAGYALLAVMIGACAIVVRRCSVVAAAYPNRETSAGLSHAVGTSADSSGPTVHRRMWWVLTAFVPSSLMLGVTTHITTNLAAVPLLWVIPLAIYLLTFVLVFARKPVLGHELMARLLPFVILPVAVLTFLELRTMGWLLIPLHLVMFFVAAMVCHGRLAKSRPSARHLTEFYLWMSVGGVLGGLFNAIVAPLVFHSVAEYPLAMVLACLVLPRRGTAEDAPRARRLDFALPGALGLVAVGIIRGLHSVGLSEGVLSRVLALGLPAMLCFSFKERPIRFGLGFGVVLLVIAYYAGLQHGRPVCVERNFFGVKRVVLDSERNLRILVHGTTKHGIQSTVPKAHPEPLAYYHRSGPIGDVFSAYHGQDAKSRIAVIGLGVGAMAAYARPGQHFALYEIDPAVARIAGDPEYFTFLTQCRGTYEIVLGDGRLTLARAPDRSYDLIVLDAFSSDAIPTHLLSREAFEVYLSKLGDGGVLVFHISNVHLNLEPVVGRLAAEFGLICRSRADLAVSEKEQARGKLPSHYVAMARSPEDLGDLADNPQWRPVSPHPDTPVWTDQYSNLLSLFRWR